MNRLVLTDTLPENSLVSNRWVRTDGEVHIAQVSNSVGCVQAGGMVRDIEEGTCDSVAAIFYKYQPGRKWDCL